MVKGISAKTIISGTTGNPQQANNVGGLYGRSETETGNKTYIPDSYRQAGKKEENTAIVKKTKEIHLQDRMIAGVLFSISHLYTGEIFPVYVGRNTIGSGKGCDIRLPEESVSTSHAVLLVRNTEATNGRIVMTASLTDYDSEYGTCVDGKPLEFDKVVCHDHDIISIGECYKFLLCLFDVPTYGMYVDENFKAIMFADENMTDKDKQESMSDSAQPSSGYFITEAAGDSGDIPDFYRPSRKAKRKAPANETVLNKVVRKQQ